MKCFFSFDEDMSNDLIGKYIRSNRVLEVPERENRRPMSTYYVKKKRLVQVYFSDKRNELHYIGTIPLEAFED